MRTTQRVGFFLGILGFVALLVVPSPPGLSPEGRRTAAVTWLMAVFWMTGAIPIPATALLNERNSRWLESQDVELSDGDTITILQGVSGG